MQRLPMNEQPADLTTEQSEHDAELRAENAYTWADLCHTVDCDHNGPRCGAWPELEAMRHDDQDWSSR